MCGVNTERVADLPKGSLADQWAEKCGAMTARKEALLRQCESLIAEMKNEPAPWSVAVMVAAGVIARERA